MPFQRHNGFVMNSAQRAQSCELSRLIRAEELRIVRLYRGRDTSARAREEFFGYRDLTHFVQVCDRYRQTLCLLQKTGYHPLSDLRILDVGCGNGNMLRQFLQWHASPEHLAGIDLRSEPVKKARSLNPGLDLRCGSGTALPWSDAAFDLVCQHTVFSSILNPLVRRQVASEMSRVLRPGGGVLWYDLRYSNPSNPRVRAIKRREINLLFPGFKIHLRPISLAPFIGRRLPEALLGVLYPLLAAIRPLRGFFLGLFVKPGGDN